MMLRMLPSHYGWAREGMKFGYAEIGLKSCAVGVMKL